MFLVRFFIYCFLLFGHLCTTAYNSDGLDLSTSRPAEKSLVHIISSKDFAEKYKTCIHDIITFSTILLNTTPPEVPADESQQIALSCSKKFLECCIKATEMIGELKDRQQRKSFRKNLRNSLFESAIIIECCMVMSLRKDKALLTKTLQISNLEKSMHDVIESISSLAHAFYAEIANIVRFSDKKLSALKLVEKMQQLSSRQTCTANVAKLFDPEVDNNQKEKIIVETIAEIFICINLLCDTFFEMEKSSLFALDCRAMQSVHDMLSRYNSEAISAHFNLVKPGQVGIAA